MSHASGTVTFKDGTVYYFEYNGTVDVAIPQIHTTREQMQDSWRNGEWRECTCKDKENMEQVDIEADYGHGIYWEGKACRVCNVLDHKYLDPHWEYKEQELEYEKQRMWGYGLFNSEEGTDNE